jgi:tyrosyl-tRNA synthetase
VLFGADPTAASPEALAAVAREVPASERSSASLGDLAEVLVETGLASSKGDARRTLEGNGYRCNGVVLGLDDELASFGRLHGRYLLLQRGRKSHHLLTVTG